MKIKLNSRCKWASLSLLLKNRVTKFLVHSVFSGLVSTSGLIILFLTAIVMGVYGYGELYNGPVWTLDNAYRTIQLFGLNWNVPHHMYRTLPLTLELARWLAVFVSSVAVIRTFLTIMGSSLELWFVRHFPCSSHVIVVGAGRKGLNLLNNFTPKYSVVAVDTDENALKKAKQQGALVVQGDGILKDTLLKAGLNTASLVFAVTGNDHTNLETGFTIFEYLKTNRTNHGAVQCFTHVKNMDLENLAQTHDAFVRGDMLDLRIFNTYETGVRLVFRDFARQMAGNLAWTGGKTFHRNGNRIRTIVVGFGDIGRLVTIYTAQWIQLPGTETPEVTVVCKNGAAIHDFIARHPIFKGGELLKLQHVERFQPFDIARDIDNKWITNLFFVEPDPVERYVHLNAWLDVLQAQDRVNTFVWVGDSRGMKEVLNKTDNIAPFGAMKDTLSKDVLVNETLDHWAKQRHYMTKKARNWADLTESHRRDARLWTDFLIYRLQVFGQDMGSARRFIETSDTETRLAFASLEYNRWTVQTSLITGTGKSGTQAEKGWHTLTSEQQMEFMEKDRQDILALTG